MHVWPHSWHHTACHRQEGQEGAWRGVGEACWGEGAGSRAGLNPMPTPPAAMWGSHAASASQNLAVIPIPLSLGLEITCVIGTSTGVSPQMTCCCLLLSQGLEDDGDGE